jgi:acetylornithine deacetylase
MRVLQNSQTPLAGDVLLELVPGEEDCVELGTLTSLARGWKPDGLVVLEPTEGQPCRASRGGLRFEITALGRAVHGTVKWLGEDALELIPAVLSAAKRLEARYNDRAADPLFAMHRFMRPITIDAVHGGTWQGMLCDRCITGGYLELLPGDELEEWGQKFAHDMLAELTSAGLAADRFTIQILERYHGHSTASDDPLCRAAGDQEFFAFNSGCEAGLRARLHQTPTLVWGPGSLAQAHAVDEYVDLAQVAAVAERFASLATRYCQSPISHGS